MSLPHAVSPESIGMSAAVAGLGETKVRTANTARWVLRRVARVLSFGCVKLKHIEPGPCLVPKRHLEDP